MYLMKKDIHKMIKKKFSITALFSINALSIVHAYEHNLVDNIIYVYKL